MNSLIQQTGDALIGLYQFRRSQFADKSKGELRDLIHECEVARTNLDWSVRAAAEINRAAAVMVLEERS